MKTKALLIAIIVVLSSAASFSQERKMVQFQMAILKKSPKWGSTAEAERNKILHQHLRNVIALLTSGKAVAAGGNGDVLVEVQGLREKLIDNILWSGIYFGAAIE